MREQLITAATPEKKFNELSQREVLVSEPRENERGKFRYVECAYWEDRKSKDEDTKEKPGRVKLEDKQRSREIFADGVNSFNVHYQETGNTRIKEYDVRGVVSFRRMDNGLFVPRLLVPEVEAKERVEWERESFVRDIATEIEEVIERYRQRALENQYFETKADRRGTTYAGQVGSGAADAGHHNDNSQFNRTNTLDYITTSTNPSARRNAGFYFAGSLPPSGSTINTATLQLYCWNPGGGDLYANFHCENADSTVDFATSATVNGRSRTTANVLKTTTGSSSGYVSLTGLASPCQEVVDRGGYDGATQTWIAMSVSASVKTFYMELYDSSSSKAAKLDIDYTAGASGLPPQRSTQINQSVHHAANY